MRIIGRAALGCIILKLFFTTALISRDVHISIVWTDTTLSQTNLSPSALMLSIPEEEKAKLNWHERKSVKLAGWPVLLVAGGLFATTDNDLFNKYDIREERNERLPHFDTNIDDYLQHVPLVAVYGLNALGVKGKNNLYNRTALLLKSELLVISMVVPMKEIFGVMRPDGRSPTAFPSGHTAQAFVAATFLHKEYGHINRWYSIGGYLMASSVGVFRVLGNRHWVSDVLAGAGIGIFATNLVYLTHKFRHDKKLALKKLDIMPQYSQGNIGFHLNYQIR